MPKDVEFTPYQSRGTDLIRVRMVQWNWEYPSRKKVKTFSITSYELKKALKKAGLYQTVEVLPIPLDHPGDEQKKMEIAMYQVLATLQAGPNTSLTDAGEKAIDKLWQRISGYLDL